MTFVKEVHKTPKRRTHLSYSRLWDPFPSDTLPFVPTSPLDHTRAPCRSFWLFETRIGSLGWDSSGLGGCSICYRDTSDEEGRVERGRGGTLPEHEGPTPFVPTGDGEEGFWVILTSFNLSLSSPSESSGDQLERTTVSVNFFTQDVQPRLSFSVLILLEKL